MDLLRPVNFPDRSSGFKKASITIQLPEQYYEVSLFATSIAESWNDIIRSHQCSSGAHHPEHHEHQSDNSAGTVYLGKRTAAANHYLMIERFKTYRRGAAPCNFVFAPR